MYTIIARRGDQTRRLRTRAPQTTIVIYTARGWTIESIRYV